MRLKDKKKRRARNSARAKEGGYPYEPGTVLKVEFWPEPESLGGVGGGAKEIGHHRDSAGFIRLTVVKTFSRTLSCVLLVSVDLAGLDDESRAAFTRCEERGSREEMQVVLKLYDRRFSDGIREDYGAAQWTPEIEEDWRRFEGLDEVDKPEVCVEGGNDSWLYRSNGEEEEGGDDERKLKAVERPRSGRKKIKAGDLAKVTSDGQQRVSPSKWTAGHREAYMQRVCDRSFSTELSIYQHLRQVQGRFVPFLYGAVRLAISGVNGMVMEYIHPSFTLRGIPENVPDQGMWQELGEMAVGLVQDVGDCGVLNEDVRLDNILVVPVQEDFRAVMIDFGLARLRREDESDEDWEKARYFRDEEGAVGYVLEHYLRTAAGEARPFNFRHSHRLTSPCDFHASLA